MASNLYFELLQLRMSIFRKSGKRSIPFLGIQNVVIDFCRVVDGKASSVLMGMILRELKESSNLMHPCPFEVRERDLTGRIQ